MQLKFNDKIIFKLKNNMTTELITTETPKRTKIVEAIIALLALRKADKDFDDAVKRIKSSCHNNLSGELSCSDQELVAVSTKLNAAAIKLNSLKSAKPKAEKLIEFGKKVGDAAGQLGGSYSGDTSIATILHDGASAAYTSQTYGDKYSNSCKYSKTDATHHVEIGVDSLPALNSLLGRALMNLSIVEDKALIGLGKIGSATWVERAAGKMIKPVTGWIAAGASLTVIGHSTISKADAIRRLDKRLAALARNPAWLAQHPECAKHLGKPDSSVVDILRAAILLNRAVEQFLTAEQVAALL